MVNSELFRQIADKVEREPESYDQGHYSIHGNCGCIFHHAEIISGQISNTPDDTGALLGLRESDAIKLFSEYWQPREGLTVPEALRLIADGATVESVSRG